jgi:hypothetical protein
MVIVTLSEVEGCHGSRFGFAHLDRSPISPTKIKTASNSFGHYKKEVQPHPKQSVEGKFRTKNTSPSPFLWRGSNDLP